jgi:DNA helicase-2/ATP-dependent DNA helicase PcrA
VFKIVVGIIVKDKLLMNLTDFHACLAQPSARGYDLNQRQKNAVDHGTGPLWLLAGPGSGKSEVLVTRALKLLCVDGVAPRSIFLTTFTTKAARNLEDRLASYLATLQEADPSLRSIDLADMRLGTLHSLCNDILQEYRYPVYQNVRLLDDVEQHLFAYRSAEIADYQDIGFWAQFEHAVPQWSANLRYPPNKWKRVKAAITLFNHISEDCVDIQKMQAADGHWAILAGFYQQYAQALRERFRCDFAHLQSRFLEFINSSAGTIFLRGDGQRRPSLQYVLVDEYQDTNPIQERIYLALAQLVPHNIAVVGDDDQALYRFRGGNVSCMVNFDQACATAFQVQPTKIQLDQNYRSHPAIVQFFSSYITSFPEMTVVGVRAPGKLPVTAASPITGSYPAVSWITRNRARDVPGAVADLITDHLLGDGIISDLSQCVLLLRSTKDSPGNAGPYLQAFQLRGIPVYNPRSKSFMESEEVQCLLAALIRVVDLQNTFQANQIADLPTTVLSWIDTLDTVLGNATVKTDELESYIQASNTALPSICATKRGNFLNLSLLEIMYRILSREPFRGWRQDLLRNQRLAKVTRLFESYHSFNLDALRADPNGTHIDPSFLNQFYNMFVSYLIEAGISDEEDEEVIVPQGYLPIMTIHQAKGLEFPFVVVGQLGNRGSVGTAQILEQELAPLRHDLYPRATRGADLLALEDDIRLLYVAYSRAQYGLILAGTPEQIRSHVAAPNRDHVAFRRSIPVI